ncbi:MAG: hypothetical protein ACE5GM_02990 [bacterium]
MSDQCKTEDVCTCGCAPKPASDECCNMPGKLLSLADQAWEELLKEKMKAEIQKSRGEKMDKIARLVVEADLAKWGHMITGKAKCEEYKQSLKELVISNCCD